MLSMQRHSKRFALIDCNNFYVSCERAFQPKLADRPIVVLSNNDGCIISRSNEVKSIGVPMGAPIFKWRKILDRYSTVVFSSNFPLYGDISSRIMSILAEYCADIEVYSIDEAFLNFANCTTDFAKEVQHMIMKCTSIPVSIGIGSTKTLAKIANKIAKQYLQYGGIFEIDGDLDIDNLLSTIDVSDIWGIGRKSTILLDAYGIKNAYELSKLPDRWVRKHLTITGLRTVQELRGIACSDIELHHARKKSIATTRSFGYEVNNLPELEQSISTYAARAAKKLRDQSSLASHISVFLHTNKFQDIIQYHQVRNIIFDEPTDYTPAIINAAISSIKHIYKDGYQYKKTGIVLSGITSNEYQQKGLFSENNYNRQRTINNLIDGINNKWGSDAIFFGSMGIKRNWRTVQNQHSRSYTTNIHDIIEVQ
ncbi:MAG: Y-family DNA polymerase [Dehalococcoidia bacterium]|nr:Y-family DNA polymerase [Dehalococcoidia bacterium]